MNLIGNTAKQEQSDTENQKQCNTEKQAPNAQGVIESSVSSLCSKKYLRRLFCSPAPRFQNLRNQNCCSIYKNKILKEKSIAFFQPSKVKICEGARAPSDEQYRSVLHVLLVLTPFAIKPRIRSIHSPGSY